MFPLIWIALSIAEVLRHVYLRKKKRQVPNKVISFCVRFVVGAAFAWFDPYDAPPQVRAVFYAFTNWTIHDYVHNLLTGVRPVWKLNDTGPIDKLQAAACPPVVWFIWKLIVFVFIILIYYGNEPY